MSVFIGIDLGTSATKAIAVGQDGEVIARARCSHPGSRSAGAGREDPRAWTESIRRACSDLGPALAEAVGVGIDVHCPVAVPMDDRGRACGLAVAWDNDVLSYYFNKYSGRRTERAVAATGNHASQSTFLAVAAAEARGVAGSSGTPRLRRVRRDWPGSSRRSCRPRGRRPREPPGRSSSRCSPRHPSAPTRPPVPGRPAPRAAGRCTDDARLEAHDIGVAAEGIEDLLWIDRGRAFSGERGMPRRGAPDAPGPG